MVGTVLLCGIVTSRLLIVASETANWRGFWFSLSHVLIVAIGVVAALRR